MTIPVTIWHESVLADGAVRLVCIEPDGKTVHVAVRRDGQDPKSELSFELSHAFDLASACLAGNQRALTTPGLSRVLCATVLCLGKAALLAGNIEPLPVDDEPEPDDGNRDDAD